MHSKKLGAQLEISSKPLEKLLNYLIGSKCRAASVINYVPDGESWGQKWSAAGPMVNSWHGAFCMRPKMSELQPNSTGRLYLRD